MFEKPKIEVIGQAWAVLEPLGFGKYFPSGDYVGWREKVKLCPHLKGKEYIMSYVASKFTKARKPLHDCELPEVYRTEKVHKCLASMIKLSDRLLAVDEELKAIIEEIEPGVHQFFPLRIEMPRGQVYPKTYYGMIILQWCDSFLPAVSENVHEWISPYGKAFYSIYSDNKADINKLVFSSNHIREAHLWRECRVHSPDFFMSDQLASAIDAAGLKIFRHYPVRLI